MIACPRQNGHAPVAFPMLRVVFASQLALALARVCEKQGSRVVHGARYHAELVLYDRARGGARFLELDLVCVVSAKADLRRELSGVKP